VTSFPLNTAPDDVSKRRQANRAIAVSALGLALTGTSAETAATTVLGVNHAHARARWTGRSLRIDVEAFLNPDITIAEADEIGHLVATALTPQIPDTRSFTWTARGLTTEHSTTPQPDAGLAASASPYPPP
jgi:hypothetical protein